MTDPAARDVFRLAKAVGVLAIIASAVSQEYASGINFVATQSLSVYPRVEYLVPLAMFVTGFVLLPKVALYMRFSRYMPRAGSAYVWIGRTLTVPVSFVVNFLWWIGLTAAIGVIAFAFGTFLGDAMLSAGLAAGAALLTPMGHIAIGLAAIWTIYWVHTAGVKIYGLLVQILFALVVVSALVIIGYGFLTPASHFVAAASPAAHTPLKAPAASPAPSWGEFLSVCTLFVFAYGGLNAAPTLGGEAVDAERTMPKGIFWAWATAVVLFTTVALAVFTVAPWWALTKLVGAGAAGDATAPGIIGLVAPHAVAVILNLLVAVIVGKALLPQLLATSRTVFAWAEDGVFGARFLQTSAAKTPNAALALVSGIGSAYLIESATVGWSLGVIIRSFSILVVLGVLAIGLLTAKFSARFRNVEWAQQVTAGWGIVAAAIASLIVAAVLVDSVLVVPKTPLVFQPAFQTAIAALVGMGLYWNARRLGERAGRPVLTITSTPPSE